MCAHAATGPATVAVTLAIKKVQQMMFKKGIMGFTKVGEFLTSFLGLDHIGWSSIAALCASVTTFITGYIWDSPSAIYTLWTLMFVDWITGIMAAIQTKTFTSTRMPRMVLYFFLTSVILGLSWNLSKSSWVFYPLPAIIFGGFCSVYFISLLENSTKLGVIPAKLRDILVERFGLLNATKEEPKKDSPEQL